MSPHTPSSPVLIDLDIAKKTLEVELLKREVHRTARSFHRRPEFWMQVLTFSAALSTLAIGLFSGILNIDRERAKRELLEADDNLERATESLDILNAQLDKAREQLQLSTVDKTTLATLQGRERAIAGILNELGSATTRLSGKFVPRAEKSAGKTTDKGAAFTNLKNAVDELRGTVTRAENAMTNEETESAASAE